MNSSMTASFAFVLLIGAGGAIGTGFVHVPGLNITAPTAYFSCMTQSSALLLIETDAPGGMAPDASATVPQGVNGCPGFWDGYYTPGGNSQASCPPECVTTGSTTLQVVNSGTTGSTVFTTTPTVTVTNTGTTTTVTLVSTQPTTTETTTATTTQTSVSTSTQTSTSISTQTVTASTTTTTGSGVKAAPYVGGVMVLFGAVGLVFVNRKEVPVE